MSFVGTSESMEFAGAGDMDGNGALLGSRDIDGKPEG
jgi:hypothetical protein